MGYKPLIKSTKGQRAKLLRCHPGVGMILYHQSDGTTCEAEFFVGRQGQLRYVGSGTPLRLEVQDGEGGEIRTVEIKSQFRPA